MLTDAEKDRVRYHLGFMSVTTAASMQFGMPKAVQTNFIVEMNMNNLLPPGEERVRRVAQVLDDIELKMIDAQDRLPATRVEELHLRSDEIDKLEGEYTRWAYRLADILGTPINPLSARFKRGVSGGNIPVRG